MELVRNRIYILLLAALTTACGSRTSLPPDEAGFTRCFDKDFDPSVSVAEKSACWLSWLQSPVGNPTDDSLRYAEIRRMELARGKSIPGPDYPGSVPHRPKLFDTAVFNREPSADAGDADTDTHIMSDTDPDTALDSETAR